MEDYYELAAAVGDGREGFVGRVEYDSRGNQLPRQVFLSLDQQIARDCQIVYGVERPEDLSWEQLDEACRRLELMLRFRTELRPEHDPDIEIAPRDGVDDVPI